MYIASSDPSFGSIAALTFAFATMSFCEASNFIKCIRFRPAPDSEAGNICSIAIFIIMFFSGGRLEPFWPEQYVCRLLFTSTFHQVSCLTRIAHPVQRAHQEHD